MVIALTIASGLTFAIMLILAIVVWGSVTLHAVRDRSAPAALPPRPDYARIAQLERELGMGDHRELLVPRSELNKLISARTQRADHVVPRVPASTLGQLERFAAYVAECTFTRSPSWNLATTAAQRAGHLLPAEVDHALVLGIALIEDIDIDEVVPDRRRDFCNAVADFLGAPRP